MGCCHPPVKEIDLTDTAPNVKGPGRVIPCVDGPWGSRRFDTGWLEIACAANTVRDQLGDTSSATVILTLVK